MEEPFSRRAFAERGAYAATMFAASIANIRYSPPASALPSGPGASSTTAPARFVSSAGNDGNDGLTPQTAWATIGKVSSEADAEAAAIYFRRGDVFYGELNLPAGAEVGAYGDGAMPILTMFKLLNEPHGWQEHSSKIWRIDVRAPETHGGYNTSTDSNIGFLIVDGAIRPARKFELSALSATWDFYCDDQSGLLYVCAPSNPATIANDIKAAPNGNAYGGTGMIVRCEAGSNSIRDVHITGTGGCGIAGSAADVHIYNCLIDYIGGGVLSSHPVKNTRYGNGIQNWTNAARWTIERNEIAHVYDVAWTAQGSDASGGPVSWRDLIVRNNYIHDCGQTVEFFAESTNSDSPGFVRIVFEGNRCERAGHNAFSEVRPDQNVRVHLLTYKLQAPIDIVIQNNTFDGAYGAYSFHAFDPPPGYVTRDNAIVMSAGHKIQFQRPETVEQFAVWRESTGREIGSTVKIDSS